jgi:hypothetical protein
MIAAVVSPSWRHFGLRNAFSSSSSMFKQTPQLPPAAAVM